MNNTFTNKNLKKINLDWGLIQSDLKLKLGTEIYESWIKKIDLVEEFNNYILLSVPTRFIRDWITSRYLDQILQNIKRHQKHEKQQKSYKFRSLLLNDLENLCLTKL